MIMSVVLLTLSQINFGVLNAITVSIGDTANTQTDKVMASGSRSIKQEP